MGKYSAVKGRHSGAGEGRKTLGKGEKLSRERRGKKKSAGQGRDPVLNKGKNSVFDTVENPLLRWGENPPLIRFLCLGSMQISQQRPSGIVM